MLRGPMLPEQDRVCWEPTWRSAAVDTQTVLAFPLQEWERVYEGGGMALVEKRKINQLVTGSLHCKNQWLRLGHKSRCPVL